MNRAQHAYTKRIKDLGSIEDLGALPLARAGSLTRLAPAPAPAPAPARAPMAPPHATTVTQARAVLASALPAQARTSAAAAARVTPARAPAPSRGTPFAAAPSVMARLPATSGPRTSAAAAGRVVLPARVAAFVDDSAAAVGGGESPTEILPVDAGAYVQGRPLDADSYGATLATFRSAMPSSGSGGGGGEYTTEARYDPESDTVTGGEVTGPKPKPEGTKIAGLSLPVVGAIGGGVVVLGVIAYLVLKD